MAVTINGTTGIETNTDTGKLKAGANDDIQIWHNGTDSRIDNATNKLEFRSADYVWKSSAGGHTYIEAIGSEGIDLYYNNSKKFETTNLGAQITGELTLTSHLKMGDGDVIAIGDSEDLKISHESSTNIVETASGVTLNWRIGSTPYLQLSGSSGVYYTKHHRPWSDDTYDLGSTGSKWDDVYATNGTIQTSDKNEKNTIVDTDLGLSFVNKLKPVSYKFNSKTRTHYGLIAQDVETTLSDISKSTTDFAGFIKTDLPDELYTDRDTIPEGKKEGDVKKAAYTTYGLRYSEFISPLIKAVQELSAEVETLKTKVAALEAA